MGKFDAKVNEGIFLGDSSSSKAYHAFNKRSLDVEESILVVFDESNTLAKRDDEDIVDLDKVIEKLATSEENEESHVQVQETQEPKEKMPQNNNELSKAWKYAKSHPLDQIIGKIEKGVSTCSSLKHVNNIALLSRLEPKNFLKAKDHESWIHAMEEEIKQFEKNQV